MATRQRKKADAPKATEQQSAQSRMVVNRKIYGAEEPAETIEGEVELFATTPAQVTIGAGVTKNTGNYESLRLEVRLTVPCYKEDLDQTADNTAAIVSERLNAEVEQYMNGGEIGPEEELDEEQPATEHRPDQGDPELTESDQEGEDGEKLWEDPDGNLYYEDENGQMVLYAEAAGEPEQDLATDVPNESDEVDEHGNPYEYDADGNRLDNEYTEDGYLIQHDDEGLPYIINDDGEVEPVETVEQEEDLPEEEADPDPAPAPKRSGRAAARNPRSSRRGRSGGRS